MWEGCKPNETTLQLNLTAHDPWCREYTLNSLVEKLALVTGHLASLQAHPTSSATERSKGSFTSEVSCLERAHDHFSLIKGP